MTVSAALLGGFHQQSNALYVLGVHGAVGNGKQLLCPAFGFSLSCTLYLYAPLVLFLGSPKITCCTVQLPI